MHRIGMGIAAAGLLASCATPRDPDLDPQPSMAPEQAGPEPRNAPDPYDDAERLRFGVPHIQPKIGPVVR